MKILGEDADVDIVRPFFEDPDATFEDLQTQMNNIDAEERGTFFDVMAKIGWVAKFDKQMEILPLLNAAKQDLEELAPKLETAQGEEKAELEAQEQAALSVIAEKEAEIEAAKVVADQQDELRFEELQAAGN